jgi:hypothetical protein
MDRCRLGWPISERTDIDSVDPISFTLRDPKDGTSPSIAYYAVDSVSQAGSGISTKTWLIVGGVAAGAVPTWLIVKPAVCDGGAQTRGSVKQIVD